MFIRGKLFLISFNSILLVWTALINLPSAATFNFDNFHIEFGKKFVYEPSFQWSGIVDISLDQCILECFGRQICEAVEYRLLSKYCSLMSNYTGIIQAPGVVTVTGFEAILRSCGTTNCSFSEACDSDNLTCSIKECGHPGLKEDLSGNKFEVHDKLSYNGIHGKQEIVCYASGQWSGVSVKGLTCEDIKQSLPEPSSGYYSNSLGMTIVCEFDTDGEGWLVFQRRLDGSVDFYRDWEDYKNGFGNFDGEFWFGLENLYTILRSTSAQFELRIDLEDWDNNTRYAVYDNFYISDETDGYRLHVGTYSGTAGDSLKDSLITHNGQMFSTKDMDHDNLAAQHCSQLYKGAWWYDDCHRANLNGLYYNGGITESYATGVNWNKWKDYMYSLKSTCMKIKEST